MKEPSKSNNWDSRLGWEAQTNINNTKAEQEKWEDWFLISLLPSITVDTADIFQLGLSILFGEKKKKKVKKKALKLQEALEACLISMRLRTAIAFERVKKKKEELKHFSGWEWTNQLTKWVEGAEGRTVRAEKQLWAKFFPEGSSWWWEQKSLCCWY